MGFFKWAQCCLSGTFGWSSPTPANFQRSRGTPAPCRTGAAWLLSPSFGGFMSPPLPSGRSGAFASSSADSQAGAESAWTNSFKPAHPPSASCEPQWGLGWFHGGSHALSIPILGGGKERRGRWGRGKTTWCSRRFGQLVNHQGNRGGSRAQVPLGKKLLDEF